MQTVVHSIRYILSNSIFIHSIKVIFYRIFRNYFRRYIDMKHLHHRDQILHVELGLIPLNYHHRRSGSEQQTTGLLHSNSSHPSSHFRQKWTTRWVVLFLCLSNAIDVLSFQKTTSYFLLYTHPEYPPADILCQVQNTPYQSLQKDTFYRVACSFPSPGKDRQFQATIPPYSKDQYHFLYSFLFLL